MKLSETIPGKNLSVLLIGYPGCGKSIAAASFPPPIYIFDLDRRINSLLQYFPNRSDIEYDYYGPDDYAALDAKIRLAKSGSLPFKTYILDSLTALARMAINYSVNLRGGGRGSIAKGVIQMTTVDDFNGESRVLSVCMDSFRAKTFNANFILTAHLVETSVKKAGPGSEDITIQRLLTGGKSIAAEIPSYFDESYYIYKEVNVMQSPATIKYLSTIIPRDGIEKVKSALPIPTTIDFTMSKAGDKGLYQKIQDECKLKGIEIG